jgi:hypothetical protein
LLRKPEKLLKAKPMTPFPPDTHSGQRPYNPFAPRTSVVNQTLKSAGLRSPILVLDGDRQLLPGRSRTGASTHRCSPPFLP